jgi:hypothetical protein
VIRRARRARRARAWAEGRLLKDAELDRLPVTRPEELVQVLLEAPGARMGNMPYPESSLWLGRVRSFDSVLFYQDREVNLRDGESSHRVRGRLVSGKYYATLGVAAAAGRLLTPEDDRPSSAPAAIISHEFWTRRFARDPAVPGRAVYVRGRPFTVVGVTPRSFFGVDRLWVPEVTIPLGSEPGQVQALARLRTGVPFEQARDEVSGRLRQLLEGGELSAAKWPTRDLPSSAGLESALDSASLASACTVSPSIPWNVGPARLAFVSLWAPAGRGSSR